MADNKTEQGTVQHKKKAREGGDRARSRELLSGAGMLAGMLTLGAVAPYMVSAWKQCLQRCLAVSAEGDGWGLRTLPRLLRWALLPAALPFAAVLAASAVAVLFVGVAQGGGLQLSGRGLKPSASRLNPGTHIKQVFSMRSMARLAKSLLPAGLVGWFGWQQLRGSVLPMPVLSLQRLPTTFAAVYGLAVKAAWVLLVWAALDYAVEWRSWNARMRMSKQEIREEVKEHAGNPQVKGRIKQLQRAMRRRKAKADMRRASVVITNPTHYAVALQFDFDTMAAPVVLGKGRDLHALDMREEARWAGVPIVENPPLARSLYRSVEPGQAIPYELYAAVAGILAFLFRQNQAQKQQEHAEAERRVREAAQAGQRARATATAATDLHGFAGGM